MNILKQVSKVLLGADENLDEWEGKPVATIQKGEQKEDKPKEVKPKESAEKAIGTDEKSKGKEERAPMTTTTLEPEAEIVEKTEILRVPVVEQVIKPRELIEVQPMVVREREQTKFTKLFNRFTKKKCFLQWWTRKNCPLSKARS
jgi:hypothetical protein